MAKWTELDPAPKLVAEYAHLIKGKTILTTGVTPGSIGAAYVEAVAAAEPALLILAGRNAAKLDHEAANIAAVAPDVATRTLIVDLMSFESARKAAAEVNSWEDVPVIDVVHNCAGIMAVPYKLSPDGYESQFAANHLGHFLLTNLIMDKILASTAPRVVNVSSSGYHYGYVRFDDINFDNGKEYEPWVAYGQSKSANCLMAISLAEKLGKRGLQAFSVHPGVIFGTSLGTHLDFSPDADLGNLMALDRRLGFSLGFGDNFAKANKPITVEQGASTSVYASFDPDSKESNGAYLLKSRVSDPFVDLVRPWITCPVEAEKLWRLSEDIVGDKFAF